MVWPGEIVPRRLGGVAAKENRPGVAHPGKQRARIIDHQFGVLGRQRIEQRHGGIEIGHHDDRAIIGPALPRDRGGGEAGQLAFNRRRHCIGFGGIAGNQDRLRHRVVLGLRQQIGGDPIGVGFAIRHDDDFGRAGDHVDADNAVKLALGLGHPGVAGAGDDIHPGHLRGAERQRGNRLRAADAQHLGNTGQPCRRQHQRVDRAARRRRHHHQPFNAGDNGRNGVHQHR